MEQLQLTQKQIDRQDFVDNEIFALFNRLLPSQKQVEWDIELIGEIRDSIQTQIVDKQKLISEEEFYPYVKMLQ